MLLLMLLVLGLAGLAGTFLIEAFLKNGLHLTLIVIPILMTVIALALVSFGSSAVTTTVLLGFWGLVATAAPVGWWTWLARTLPDAAEAAGHLPCSWRPLRCNFGQQSQVLHRSGQREFIGRATHAT